MTPENFAQWFGCAMGLLGSLLLATNTSHSRFGWIAFLLSNLAWIAYALWADAMGLLLQQIGFTATSLLGIRKWFFQAGPKVR